MTAEDRAAAKAVDLDAVRHIPLSDHIDPSAEDDLSEACGHGRPNGTLHHVRISRPLALVPLAGEHDTSADMPMRTDADMMKIIADDERALGRQYTDVETQQRMMVFALELMEEALVQQRELQELQERPNQRQAHQRREREHARPRTQGCKQPAAWQDQSTLGR